MHVAPPEDRFDATDQRKAAIRSEHLAQARVLALDDVVGRISRAAVLLLNLHEREQLPALDELVRGPSCLPRALMGVEALAILQNELPHEGLQSCAPIVVLDGPCGVSDCALCVSEPVGDPQKLAPAF